MPFDYSDLVTRLESDGIARLLVITWLRENGYTVEAK